VALLTFLQLVVGCAGARPHAPAISSASPTHASSGSSAATAPSHGLTREVTERERALIEPLMRDAERVRALRFERPVPVLVQDAQAIMAYVDTQIEAEDVERAQLVYESLGLLPVGLDIRALWLRLMGEQVMGYYDLEHGRLVVRDDVMRALLGTKLRNIDVQEARVVLVHELVHALQDQRLGLRAVMDADRDTDADNALHALVEGDATLAMIGYTLAAESVPLSELTRNPARVRNLAEIVRSSPMTGTELDSAPAIVRVPLLSAYVEGLGFAASLHGAGGWARVNRAHSEPPASTEQVLHPEHLARNEVPRVVRLPSAKSLLSGTHTLAIQDTLGELEIGVYFGLASDEPSAQRAARGWAGDRVYIFRGERGAAAVWVTSWDSERDAIEAEQAALRVQQRDSDADPSAQLVRRVARDVLIVRGLATELHARVVARFEAWTSRGSATLAKIPAEDGDEASGAD
jgi:hypothetical protein